MLWLMEDEQAQNRWSANVREIQLNAFHHGHVLAGQEVWQDGLPGLLNLMEERRTRGSPPVRTSRVEESFVNTDCVIALRRPLFFGTAMGK